MIRDSGEQSASGQDAVSPFGDAAEASDEDGSSSAPIVLGDEQAVTQGSDVAAGSGGYRDPDVSGGDGTSGAGAGQQTLAQQAQANMPLELAPAAGTMLTGAVATLGEGAWGAGTVEPDKGSFWKGMARTCIFAFVMLVLLIGTIAWAEGGYNWHNEQVQVAWTDDSHLDGSFTLPNAPIEECSLSFYNERNWRYYDDNDYWHLNTDCDGTITVSTRVDAGYYTPASNVSENGSVTVIFQQPPADGRTVDVRFEGWGGGGYDRQIHTTTGDGVATDFTFPVDVDNFDRCSFSVYASSGSQSIYTQIDGWYDVPPDCPPATLSADLRENAGFIDLQSGYGEINLTQGAPSDLDLWADYEEEYDGDGFAREIGPCFSILAALVLGIVWLVQLVNAYKAGLSSKGNGMLAGIVPAFGILIVVQIIAVFVLDF